MKRILVPVDFSQQSENALAVALKIAKKTNASLLLLHVVEAPINPQVNMMGDAGMIAIAPESIIPEQQMKHSEIHLNDIKAKYARSGVDIEVKVELDLESGFSGIDNVISEHRDIDLVIMGSKGASGFKEILIGSNTGKVVKRAHVPVLVVKDDHLEGYLNKVVFPTDFDAQNPKLIKAIVKMVALFGAELHLLYVNSPLQFHSTDKINELKKAFVAEHHIHNAHFAIVNDFSEEKGIFYYVKEVNADLIIMPTHGKTGLEAFFSGSVTADVVNHSPVSVLTFNMKNF